MFCKTWALKSGETLLDTLCVDVYRCPVKRSFENYVTGNFRTLTYCNPLINRVRVGLQYANVQKLPFLNF